MSVINQLQPQVKRETVELRLKIAQKARYYPNRVNHHYAVKWDGQEFISDDTGDLIDQVIAWLKLSKEDRTEIIEANGHELNDTCLLTMN